MISYKRTFSELFNVRQFFHWILIPVLFIWTIKFKLYKFQIFWLNKNNCCACVGCVWMIEKLWRRSHNVEDNRQEGKTRWQVFFGHQEIILSFIYQKSIVVNKWFYLRKKNNLGNWSQLFLVYLWREIIIESS